MDNHSVTQSTSNPYDGEVTVLPATIVRDLWKVASVWGQAIGDAAIAPHLSSDPANEPIEQPLDNLFRSAFESASTDISTDDIPVMCSLLGHMQAALLHIQQLHSQHAV